jgi:hypothetical protein
VSRESHVGIWQYLARLQLEIAELEAVLDHPWVAIHRAHF